MGLFPSCNDVQGKGLPVLGDPPFPADRVEIAKAELRVAFPDAEFEITSEERKAFKPGTKAHQLASCGITIPGLVGPDDTMSVTLYRVKARAHGWEFTRCWYYWACNTKTNPIPEAVACEFNDRWGRQVRVNGYSGGTDVSGEVDAYHVDTLVGLKALAELIRSSRERGEETR